MKFDDRRHEPRVNVIIGVKQTSAKGVALCQTVDLSPTGMGVRVPVGTSVEVPCPVDLQFSLPGSEQVLNVSGTVIYQVGGARVQAMGIRFKDLRSRAVRIIQQFVEKAAGPLAAAA